MAAPDRFAFTLDPQFITPAYLGPGVTPTLITAGAGDLATKPRFLHVSGAAGSVTYVANGFTITEVLEVGYHPIRPDKITAIAGGTTVVAWT
jgi:hypothetical protein